MQPSYLVRFSDLDKHVLCPWTFVLVWMPMDKVQKQMWLFSFRHLHERVTKLLHNRKLYESKRRMLIMVVGTNETTSFTANIFLFRERRSEHSPFPCESLVYFLDFGLTGVSGHSKNFVGIKLGRRC